MDIEKPKVVSISGGKVEVDGERRFIEELALKVRAHVEQHGALPDLAVLVLFGEATDESGNNWSAGYYSPDPRSAIEAYGIAMATITKTLGR